MTEEIWTKQSSFHISNTETSQKLYNYHAGWLPPTLLSIWGHFWKRPNSAACVATTCVDGGFTSAPHGSDKGLSESCGMFCHSWTIAWRRSCTVWWMRSLLLPTFQLVLEVFSWWQIRWNSWPGQAVDISALQFLLLDSGSMSTGLVLLQHSPWLTRLGASCSGV